MITILRLIKGIYTEVYVEKSDLSDPANEKQELINSILQMKEYGKHLGLSGNEFKCNVYEFKRYDVTDYIDDEELCENYLSYCAHFELAPAPAILLNIHFHNQYCKTIKIIGSEIIPHSEDLFKYITEKIILSVGLFHN